ncbi:response regulator [Aliarcobacter butzleri]|jgi:CheY-like chemotaxis protein|uniref:Response regulator receiver n=3 Tax=Aliarcobacter butzleri TaxID=28197 RepID=A0A837JDD6_9BACT|nr:response regulator [Aliarcobacter butzleri]KLD96114.1 response regulator receiver [Aliarcobacter butzleri L348]KLE06016.1 response regulator receiver [Aliarcobacter butzleri L352]KLE08320.1 response regulator receiver [Aliarcobacter butzleri L354]MCG3653341.1 response regulator [Aliarcobacter butzleri]MCG3656142.1 response regulator [Aliarcobacter butzleri]
MKVLVTDDSKMARKMVVRSLEESTIKNLEIFEAQNGQEAIDLYKEISPKIVFLDLTMPIMDGFEALKRIKEIDENAKVVIISADIQKLSMDRVRELGAFNFIKKPIDSLKMQQILEKIDEVI